MKNRRFSRALLAWSVFLFMLPPQRAFTDEFETLFTTKTERLRLNALRREHDMSEQPPSSGSLQENALSTLNGIVQRQDGRNTVWLNSINYGSKTRLMGDKIIDPQAVEAGALTIRFSRGRLVSLRPRQILDLKTGELSDPINLAKYAPFISLDVCEKGSHARNEKRISCQIWRQK